MIKIKSQILIKKQYSLRNPNFLSMNGEFKITFKSRVKLINKQAMIIIIHYFILI